MAGPLELLLLVGTPAALGACAAMLLGLRARQDALAFAAWSWLLGALLVAALLFAALVAGVPLAALRWVPLLALALLLPWCWRAGRRRVAVAGPQRGPGRTLLLVVTAACLLLTCDRILRADELVVCGGDEGTMWSLKAKAIWLSHGLTPEFAAMVAAPGPLDHKAMREHADYPLQDPLLQLWSFACAGDITHVQNRLVVQVFALALLLLLASAARRVAPAGVAAAAVALVALSGDFQEACGWATADILVALGLLASLDAWSRWRQSGEQRFLALFAACLASLAWSKNEGAMLAVAAGAACLATAGAPGRSRGLQALALLPAAAVLVAQAIFNASFDLHSDLFAHTAAGGFLGRVGAQTSAHLPVIGRYLLDDAVLDVRSGNLVPAMLLLALLVFPVRLTVRAPAATTTLLLGAAAYLLVYLGTPRLIEWHLRFSLHRVLLQLSPLAVVWLAGAAAWLMRPDQERAGLA
ncbi:MAG TPA: hypothetical protein VFY71_10660 [Planctomycetota bacterium]|nr:hypothetical protein [Planctomycetota bacterium]